MINTVQQALEDVYVALGGQEDIDRLTVSQVLAKIYNVLGGTGDHGDETVPQLIDLIATVAPSGGGGGGGGVTWPTFTAGEYSWTCDMTYSAVKSLYDENKGDGTSIPCNIVDSYNEVYGWYVAIYTTDPEDISGFFNVPESVTAGFMVYVGLAGFLFGSDGNTYQSR